MAYTRQIDFPFESEKAFEIWLSNSVIRHLLDEHITKGNMQAWITRLNLDETLVRKYAKSRVKNYDTHKELYDSIASVIYESINWSAILPQYIYTKEKVLIKDAKNKEKHRINYVLVTKYGNLIILKYRDPDKLDLVTSYYPVVVYDSDSNYTLFVRSIKTAVMKYGKKKIHDIKYNTEREIKESRYVSEAHWIVVPSYREYCGGRK